MSSPASPLSSDPDRVLVRAIGLPSAVLLVIGNVIGSGIFLTTGIMLERLPSEGLVLLAWALGGVLALAGGLTYAEMGAMYPRSGGLYVFLTEAYGPLWGFLFGWAGLLVVLTGSVATVAVGFAEYFSYFVPSLSTRRELMALPLPWGAWTISAGQLVAATSIAVLGAINYVGIRWGNAVQAAFTVLKVAALAAVALLAFSAGRTAPTFTPLVPDVPRIWAAFGVIMIAVMWTYEGWYYVAFAAGEIRDPRRTVPRALILGILALTTIYLVVNVAYMYALSLEELRGVERVAERAATALLGPVGGAFVAATVAVSTFGCNAAAVIGTSRVCYAMAADGWLWRRVAAVHPVYRTPHVAVVVTSAWAALLTLTGTYEQLFTYVTFASVLFFVLGGAAVFRLRRIRPDQPRPYRTWGYPIVPAVFVAGSAWLVVNTLVERPIESLAGLALVILGVPVYWTLSRTRTAVPAGRLDPAGDEIGSTG
jgi:APA family basic amino acid/polyamine antiporter